VFFYASDCLDLLVVQKSDVVVILNHFFLYEHMLILIGLGSQLKLLRASDLAVLYTIYDILMFNFGL
jgi:hypothetical protein